MATSLPYPEIEVHYPYSDGLPMAESDFQRKPLSYAVDALSVYFQSRQDVYVSGNMFLYYEEGNPKMVVAPDVFVVIGADDHERLSYKLWCEPKAPDFVLEITSKSTRSEDQGPKRGIYAYLQVQEYWQYDPTGDYLVPPLQGLYLVGENYQPMPTAVSTGGAISLHSKVLGLDLRCEKGVLRFYDPVGKHYLLTYQEADQARREAENRVQQEAVARQAAEARLAELEAQLQAMQAEAGSKPTADDT